MELNWLQSLLYGLISGFTEFLPICPDGHRFLFLSLFGASDYAAIRLSVHFGGFCALFFLCVPMIARLNRERKIASITERRRKRQPDMRSIMDLRFLKVAVIPVILCAAAHPFVSSLFSKSWILAALLFLNGCLLYIPQFYPHANKDALTLSGKDAVFIGMATGFGIFPGISQMATALSIGSLRGADRRYILDIILLLCIPMMLILIILDFFAVFTAAATLSFASFLCCFTAALMSFIGAYFGIYMMRFFAVRVGFSGFAYYSWGLALLTFILYLTIS